MFQKIIVRYWPGYLLDTGWKVRRYNGISRWVWSRGITMNESRRQSVGCKDYADNVKGFWIEYGMASDLHCGPIQTPQSRAILGAALFEMHMALSPLEFASGNASVSMLCGLYNVCYSEWVCSRGRYSGLRELIFCQKMSCLSYRSLMSIFWAQTTRTYY